MNPWVKYDRIIEGLAKLTYTFVGKFRMSTLLFKKGMKQPSDLKVN